MKTTAVEEKLEKVRADALAVFLFEGEKPTGEVEKLDRAVSGSISEAINLGDFKGKLYEVTSIYTHGKVPSARIFLTGAGKKGDFDTRIARNVAGAAARRSIKLGVKKLAIYLNHEVGAEEIIEGVGLANYDPALYKTKKEENGEVEELILVGSVNQQTIKYSSVLLESTNWVRKLINEPPNIVTPARMVEEARKLAKNYKFDLEVIDEDLAKKRGFGAFVGVAKGSDEPSFVVVLKYKGGGKETLGVVGKGITYDAGGISLKPSKYLTDMKADMTGAAAAYGVMRVVGELRPRINVTMVCPLTENMPSGKALKPDDVITSLSGKTIEITNMDAEGRVVLADALTYVQKLGATKIVDLATLTGAVSIILGREAAAVMGSPQSWVDQLLEVSKESGERMWQLPMYEEYKAVLKSDIADVANAYKRHPEASTIAGGVFLKEFISGKTDWVHVDLGDVAWLDEEKPFLAKGANGFGVRTIVKLIESLEKAN